MKVYIVKINFHYEGFKIDSAYVSESDAQARADRLNANSRLPYNHINHEFIGDGVTVEALEVVQ